MWTRMCQGIFLIILIKTNRLPLHKEVILRHSAVLKRLKPNFVISAKAGIQGYEMSAKNFWMPASAGMTLFI